MSKITSKRQVTIPKDVADEYGIGPGDVIEWQAAGDFIRVLPAGWPAPRLSLEERLRLFDLATARKDDRVRRHSDESEDRGWTRDELYERGSSG